MKNKIIFLIIATCVLFVNLSLAEEINNIYDALTSSVKTTSEKSSGILYSLRDYGSDDDDDGNWN